MQDYIKEETTLKSFEELDAEIKRLDKLKAVALERKRQEEANAKARELQNTNIAVEAAIVQNPVAHAATNAAKLLDMIGARFKIVLPSGEEFTHTRKTVRQVSKVTRRTNTGFVSKYPRGEVNRWVQKQVRDLLPGHNIVLTPDIFDLDAIGDTVGKVCHKLWGPKAYTTQKRSQDVLIKRHAVRKV